MGSFDFPNRIDFVRVPGIIKLRDGEYTSLRLNIATEETLAMRASIIHHTASIFDPDLVLIDKEPLGLRGEVRDTLDLMRDRGTPVVLGVRDVLDDPAALIPEWRRKQAVAALDAYYSAIWVFGCPDIYRPLEAIALPDRLRDQIVYTGYLRRTASETPAPLLPFDGPFLLVTPGGGGDGEQMVDWVLSAYEHAADLPHPALIVTGPFMPLERRLEYQRRAEALARVAITDFDAHLENLMTRATGVVAMGGYNTFCEILSFDKPALVIPRRTPRLEQTIRARRAAGLGLVRILETSRETGSLPPGPMINALRSLADQPVPSRVMRLGLLDGLDRVAALTDQLITQKRTPRDRTRFRVVGGG